jgi:hypothetical protein
MEYKWADPVHRRNSRISQHPKNIDPLGVRNPFYGMKVCKHSVI